MFSDTVITIFLCGCHQALNSSDLGFSSVGYGYISYLVVLVQMTGKSLCEILNAAILGILLLIINVIVLNRL